MGQFIAHVLVSHSIGISSAFVFLLSLLAQWPVSSLLSCVQIHWIWWWEFCVVVIGALHVVLVPAWVTCRLFCRSFAEFRVLLDRLAFRCLVLHIIVQTSYIRGLSRMLLILFLSRDLVRRRIRRIVLGCHFRAFMSLWNLVQYSLTVPVCVMALILLLAASSCLLPQRQSLFLPRRLPMLSMFLVLDGDDPLSRVSS